MHNQSIPVVAATEAVADPLLHCLQEVSAWHGLEFSRPAILAGLSLVEGRLNPALLLQAAARAGFRAQLVERALGKIPQSVLPAIVLLTGDRAGVLMPGEAGSVGLHFEKCETDELAEIDLKKVYSGFAVLLQPNLDASEEMPVPTKWWFWQTMWKFRGYYLCLVPAALLVSGLGLVMPLFTMLIYDRVVPNDSTETLWVLALGVATVFGFEYLLRLLRGSVLERAGREMDMVLASTLFEQILALEMQGRPSSPSALAARTKAYEVLRDFFMSATMLAIVDLPFSLLMLGALFFIGGPIGWMVVGMALLAMLIGCFFQLPLRRSVVASSESGVERQALVAETINGLESIKGANAEGALQGRFERLVNASAEKEVRMHWYSLLGTSTTATLINLTNVGLVVAAVYRVHAGDLTTGGMIACLMLSSRTMTPIAMIAGLMTRLQQALQSLQGLNLVMALPRETGGNRKFITRPHFDFNYDLENVSVRYPGQAVPALSEVSLQIGQGQRIALVGRMGSGKSTLLRLLAKLYSPCAGKVLLDGVDLEQYHPSVVRQPIGYLAQDAAVFSGTIRENVALGAHGVTDEQILEAIRLAGLEEFVKRNPRGIHAAVGEQGSMLSGGQRRAVVLARSFLRRPRILLLDEPVSSMDSQSEKEFVHALKGYLDQDPRHTLVVATHKSSMLTLVDQIIVLHEGKVFAAGEKSVVLAKLSEQVRSSQATPTNRSRPGSGGGPVRAVEVTAGKEVGV